MALKNNRCNHSPGVSLIIATYNRKDELKGLLKSLESQTLDPEDYEIIIVDDGSTDGTPDFLKQAERSTCPIIKSFRQDNTGPGAARNLGADRAGAHVFAFTDTDCRPMPDWLENIIKPFSNKETGVVGGSEEVHADDSGLMQAIHFCMTSPFTTGGMRGKTGVRLARYYPRTFNMAVSREAFFRTGGFRHMYHGEDIEFSFRIKKAGYKVCFTPEAKVYHRRRCSMRQFFRQVFHMGEARVNLWAIHPEMLEPLHIIPTACLVLLSALIILSFFSSLFMKILLLFLFTGFCFACLLVLNASKQSRNPGFLLQVPIIFFLQQLGYGSGFIWRFSKNLFKP